MAIQRYAVSMVPRDDMTRNVQEIYKKWVHEEILADLESRRSGAVQIILNAEKDFNIATCIRNANALNIGETYIVGARRYDKRGTVGTHHYTNVYHADTVEEVFEHLRGRGYAVYAVEKMDGHVGTNLWDEELPNKSAFVFGTENSGIPVEVIDQCDKMLEITMLGSVRSFNLGCSSAIVLAEYSRQHRG